MVKNGQLARGVRREKELRLAEGQFRVEASAFLSWEERWGSQAATGVLVLETQANLQFACHGIIEEDFKLFCFGYCLTLGKVHQSLHAIVFIFSSPPLINYYYFKHCDSLL